MPYIFEEVTGSTGALSFKFNGQFVLKNYNVEIINGNRLKVTSNQNEMFSLLEADVSEIEINGTTYTNPEAAQFALQALVFSSNEPVVLSKEKYMALAAAVQSADRGKISPSTPIPEGGWEIGWYKPAESSSDPGTNYPNQDNLKSIDGFINRFYFNGSNWDVVRDKVQTINNITNNFNPDQIVPTEALYNDVSQTVAVDMLKRVDLTTGFDANYRETTIWYDGSAINATKVDDVIFQKIGTKYYVLVDFAAGVPVNVKYFGVKGDGVTDDTQKNQKALDLSIKYGFVLYYPKGVYLVSWANKQSGYIAPVDFSSSTENYKSVQIIGDGTDKSKILLAPGQADLQGRYTECARYYANKAGKITSKISIKGISIDMNARSNVFASASGVPFFYEQSHALVFNGHATNEERVDFIDIDDVEIIDKIGGGIVFATAPKMSIGRITVDNFVSLKHTQFPNSIYGPIIKLGMRGDLELGAKSDASFITGCKMQYTQIEPVIASSAEFKRNTNISDVIVDKFEFTDRGGFSFVNASKLTAKSFLVRGIQGDFTNCTVTFDGGVSNGNLKFFGGTILVKYNSTTNSLSPAQFGIVAEATEKYTFDSFGTVFKIDSSDPNITPTGFMFRGNGSTTQSDAERFRYNLYGCSFDPRSEKNIEAYAHGIWKITNSIFACRGNAIYTGSFTGYYCSVEIVDCNFKDVVGRPINIQASVNTFYLKVVGTYDMYGKHFFERTAGTAFIPNTTIPNSATFISDAPILNGFMPYNQLILKKDSTGGLIGWRQSSLTNVQNWREINEFTKAPTQAASTATDVTTIVTDFNALLTKLKNAGIVS